MSGRWQVKHPDMRLLAREAAVVAASFGSGHVTYSWIPRERNTRADRLANKAMDSSGSVKGSRFSGGASASDGSGGSAAGTADLSARDVAPDPVIPPVASRAVTWPGASTPSTLLFVRHGVTTFTIEKRFSGSGDPPLIEAGARRHS
jgi:hypothetical protein